MRDFDATSVHAALSSYGRADDTALTVDITEFAAVHGQTAPQLPCTQRLGAQQALDARQGAVDAFRLHI